MNAYDIKKIFNGELKKDTDTIPYSAVFVEDDCHRSFAAFVRNSWPRRCTCTWRNRRRAKPPQNLFQAFEHYCQCGKEFNGRR